MPLETTKISGEEFAEITRGMIIVTENDSFVTYDVRGGEFANRHKNTGECMRFRLDAGESLPSALAKLK